MHRRSRPGKLLLSLAAALALAAGLAIAFRSGSREWGGEGFAPPGPGVLSREFLPEDPGRGPPLAEAAEPPPPPAAEAPAGEPVELRDLPSPREGVVINEVHYHPPGDDLRDEWIELFNRGRTAVDLGGWRLAGAVELTFSRGTRLEPGAHAVAAASAEKARQTLGLDALGDWTGDLSDGGETIRLLDAEGKEVEAVTYDDQGLFPSLPDGGGRSLERRDPHSPASPANWGSSSTGGWVRISGTGAAPTRRLYLYLLGPGTAYVDDLTLRPVDGGREVRLGFEGEETAWAFNGSHAASAITTEAARSGRRSLRLSASAAGASVQDSVSTELAAVRPGGTYSLEGWAYLPQGTTLEVRFSRGRTAPGGARPAPGLSARGAGGGGSTPGRPNSIHAATLPPFVHPISHSPPRPAPGQEVVVSARVEAFQDLEEVLLHWDDGSGERTVPLIAATQEKGPLSARLGPFRPGTLVRYRVSARDRAGGRGSYPFPGDPTRSRGFHLEPPGPRAAVPVYHLFISRAALQDLESNPYSDAYRSAVFVHDGEVYPDVGIRFRGQTSRYVEKKHWKVRFNRDRKFITPGGETVKSINLNSFYGDGTYLREALGYGLWRDLGRPYHETHHVRVNLNGSHLGLYLHLEVPNEDFLERNGFPGWLWKSYSDGHDALQFELEAGDPASGTPALMELLAGVNGLSGRELEEHLRRSLDVESFIDYLAGCQLVHSADHVQKNHLVHAGPDLRFTFLPWDMDLTHGRNYECRQGGIWNSTIRHDLWDPDHRDERLLFGARPHPKCDGWWNSLIDAVLVRSSSFRPLYYRRLAELLPRHYHPEVIVPRAERLLEAIRPEVEMDRARWGGSGEERDPDRAMARFRRWAADRYEHLRRKLEALGHPVGEPLNAWFECGAARGAAPLEVRFRDLSVGRIESTLWDFGDGSTSEDREPVHTYRAPGRYDVTLTVSGPAGKHAVRRKALVKAR